MKKLIYTFLLFAGVTAFAQTTSSVKPIIVADGMVASKQFLDAQTKNIKAINIYKTPANLPADLKKFEAYAKNGLVSATFKDNHYDRIPFSALNKQFGLPAENPVYFDGNLIADTSILVLGEVLEDMKVGNTEGKNVLNIWSTAPKMIQVAK